MGDTYMILNVELNPDNSILSIWTHDGEVRKRTFNSLDEFASYADSIVKTSDDSIRFSGDMFMMLVKRLHKGE
jgi:hypothetical protein